MKNNAAFLYSLTQVKSCSSFSIKALYVCVYVMWEGGIVAKIMIIIVSVYVSVLSGMLTTKIFKMKSCSVFFCVEK